MEELRLLTDAQRVKLRDEYIDVALNVDQFRMECSGYWARGVRFVKARGLGWLVWEDDESHLKGEEPERLEAVRSWRLGAYLPSGWYRWDRSAAEKAYAIGERLWGENWYEKGDANSYDAVMQLVLLGEVRYG